MKLLEVLNNGQWAQRIKHGQLIAQQFNVDKAQTAQQIKNALLAVQQFITDDTDHVDTDLRYDPMYGFSLRASAKLLAKKLGKSAGTLETVILRFKLTGNDYDPVTATIDSSQVYYQCNDDDNKIDWNSDKNLKSLAKEVVKVLNRRTIPESSPIYRLGNLNALEGKYKAQWSNAPRYDGRQGIIITSLKTKTYLNLYVAKKSDNPNDGNYGYIAIVPESNIQHTFIALESEMLAFVERWVKDNL